MVLSYAQSSSLARHTMLTAAVAKVVVMDCQVLLEPLVEMGWGETIALCFHQFPSRNTWFSKFFMKTHNSLTIYSSTRLPFIALLIAWRIKLLVYSLIFLCKLCIAIIFFCLVRHLIWSDKDLGNVFCLLKYLFFTLHTSCCCSKFCNNSSTPSCNDSWKFCMKQSSFFLKFTLL